MSTTSRRIVAEMRRAADPERARLAARFFKTGPGEYGEGDAFLGLTMPQVRATLKAHPDLTPAACVELLASKWHEVRALAVLGLARLAKRGDPRSRLAVRRIYLRNAGRIDNWDLVDISAPDVVGRSVLERRDLEVLEKLARSKSLWQRRIAIVSTFAHLRTGDVEPTLRIAEIVVDDRHDLMHKACGWLLREVGKRDAAALDAFLERHAATMPRTALRYAVERMSPNRRREWMAVKAASRRR
ncbi:MAG: DNA alkylation repair protein [Gemmatimonadales bacterium]